MAKKYLRDIELAAYLKQKYKTARGLSDAAGISTQYAYNILDRGAVPLSAVLERVGIYQIYEVRQ